MLTIKVSATAKSGSSENNHSSPSPLPPPVKGGGINLAPPPLAGVGLFYVPSPLAGEGPGEGALFSSSSKYVIPACPPITACGGKLKRESGYKPYLSWFDKLTMTRLTMTPTCYHYTTCHPELVEGLIPVCSPNGQMVSHLFGGWDCNKIQQRKEVKK